MESLEQSIDAKELYGRRKGIELEGFVYLSGPKKGDPIYQNVHIPTLKRDHKFIFSDEPGWSVAEMIDYCTSGRAGKNKVYFLEYVLVCFEENEEVVKYLSKIIPDMMGCLYDDPIQKEAWKRNDHLTDILLLKSLLRNRQERGMSQSVPIREEERLYNSHQYVDFDREDVLKIKKIK